MLYYGCSQAGSTTVVAIIVSFISGKMGTIAAEIDHDLETMIEYSEVHFVNLEVHCAVRSRFNGNKKPQISRVDKSFLSRNFHRVGKNRVVGLRSG